MNTIGNYLWMTNGAVTFPGAHSPAAAVRAQSG
jgi:hypothetical protein